MIFRYFLVPRRDPCGIWPLDHHRASRTGSLSMSSKPALRLSGIWAFGLSDSAALWLGLVIFWDPCELLPGPWALSRTLGGLFLGPLGAFFFFGTPAWGVVGDAWFSFWTPWYLLQRTLLLRTSLRGTLPPLDPPPPDRPTFRSFLTLLPHVFLFFSIWGSSRGIVVAIQGRGALKCAFGLPGSFCETPTACWPPGL